MLKRIELVTLLIVAISLTGCIKMDLINDIHSDGSGFKIFIAAMDKDTLKSIQEMTTPAPGETEDPFADSCKQAEEIPGAKCEPYEDEEMSGMKVTAPFANLDELVALSNYELFKSDSVSYEQDGSVITLHFTLQTGEMGEEIASESGEMEGTPSNAEMEEAARQILELMDIEFYYRAIVPGKILDYKPQDNATVEGNEITWEVDILAEEKTQEFMVQYDASALPGPLATDTPRPDTIKTVTPAPEVAEATPSEISPKATVTPEKKGGLGIKGLPCTCPCLPGLILPLGAVGSIVVLRRRKLPLG